MNGFCDNHRLAHWHKRVVDNFIFGGRYYRRKLPHLPRRLRGPNIGDISYMGMVNLEIVRSQIFNIVSCEETLYIIF